MENVVRHCRQGSLCFARPFKMHEMSKAIERTIINRHAFLFIFNIRRRTRKACSDLSNLEAPDVARHNHLLLIWFLSWFEKHTSYLTENTKRLLFCGQIWEKLIRCSVGGWVRIDPNPETKHQSDAALTAWPRKNFSVGISFNDPDVGCEMSSLQTIENIHLVKLKVYNKDRDAVKWSFFF